MKRFIPLLVVATGACAGAKNDRFEIEVPPEMLATATNTALLVPKSCPAFAPGGGDVDTPEAPFPEKISIICGVDEVGATYSLVVGDAPTASLNILPGNQELGLYIGVEANANFTPAQATLGGDTPILRAWSAAVNVEGRTECCAESQPNSELKLQMVAAGSQGMLISLGKFDGAPTQVAFNLNTAVIGASQPPPLLGSWLGRFYVNGEP
jgi:hypothetical protein